MADAGKSDQIKGLVIVEQLTYMPSVYWPLDHLI